MRASGAAVTTKLSNAEIRTTHLTGIVTDIGIELGKWSYWNRSPPGQRPKVTADIERLKVLIALAGFFFIGGIIGALGFKHIGYAATVPLDLIITTLIAVPIADDLNALIQNRKERASL